MMISERTSTEPIQYYLALPGLPGADVALLAARGALLAHRRFRDRPGYARWFGGTMAKVVLRAPGPDLAELARLHDALLVPEPPEPPLLAVFRPRPRDRAPFLRDLKLYSGSVGAIPGLDWPGEGLWLPLYLNADLNMSAGKVAAQAAHAALIAQATFGGERWAAWTNAGGSLAMLRVPERLIVERLGSGAWAAVADAGRTAVPGGSLTVAVGPPDDPSAWPRDEATLLALAPPRHAPKPRV
ncbi:MAG: peptidyl-tRNA hydrolase [Chloroflexota bacterium]